MARQLSLRELAERATMHHPNIAAIEAGRLPVGETTARRLAHALVLSAEEESQLVLMLVKPKTNASRGSFPSTLGIVLGAQLRMAGMDPGNLIEFFRYEHPAPFDTGDPFTLWIAVEKGCKLNHENVIKKLMAILRKKRGDFILLFVARKNGTVTLISIKNDAQ